MERLREAETLATALDDRRRLGRILAFSCHALRNRRDEDAAIAAGQRALALGEELGDIDLQVDARYVLAQTHYWLGDYPRARELLSRNVETLATGDWGNAASAFLQPVTSRAWLAMTLASLGDFDEGIRHGEEATRIAESDGRPSPRVIAQSSLGFLHLARGDGAIVPSPCWSGAWPCTAPGASSTGVGARRASSATRTRSRDARPTASR